MKDIHIVKEATLTIEKEILALHTCKILRNNQKKILNSCKLQHGHKNRNSIDKNSAEQSLSNYYLDSRRTSAAIIPEMMSLAICCRKSF